MIVYYNKLLKNMLVKFHFKKEHSIILIFTIIMLLNSKFINSNLQIKDIISFLSQFLLIIFYFIEKKLSKIHNENQQIIIKLKGVKDYSKQKMIIILIFIIILQICFEYCEKFKQYSELPLNRFLIIIYIYIIDLIIFQYQIYSHHIISLIINLIILILLIVNEFENIINRYYYIPYFIIINYSFSFSFILIKYLNEKYFMNIYLIASIIGLFKLLFKLFYVFILFNNSFGEINIKFSLICLMISFIINFLNYYLIYKMGLLYSFICFFLSTYIYSIIIAVTEIKNLYLIILLILSIISAMIYLEILELNFCGLNNGLKEKIKERAIQESEKIDDSISTVSFKDINELLLNK